MTENIVRYVIDNTSDAWSIYRKWAMREIAVREIQRIIRGYMGRTEALFLQILFKSAVLLQCTYRGKLARRRYMAMKRKRNWAAAELQRHVRGVLAKRLALNRLEGFLESERTRLKKEIWEWENAEMIAAVKSIQGQYRKLQARRKVHLLKDKKAREAIIQEEMEDMVKASKRDRKIYERQVMEWYEKKRIAWEENNVLEAHTAKEKAKIRSYQRNQKEMEKMREADLKTEHEEKLKEQNVEAWLGRWEKIAEERCIEYKEFCANCMVSPDTPHERKMGKKLKEKVNKRYHDVLKRADAKHIPMEAPEAREIAMEEVLYIMGEEEKARVVLEMKEKAKEHEEKEKQKLAHVEIQNEKQRELDREHAALVLGLQYRKWHARKLLRQKCYERMEKRFNEQYCAFYYYNRKTGDIVWEKPKALGSYDMVVVNEWRPMRDTQNYPYYYNPHTMQMIWGVPANTRPCEMTDYPQTWIFGYPTPLGQCPNFATRRCNDDMHFYCDDCWVRKYNPIQRRKMYYKVVQGHEPNSDKIQYDDSPDKIDIFEEDEIAAAEEAARQKRIKEESTILFDAKTKEDTLFKGGVIELKKKDFMVKQVAITADDVAKKAESLTMEGMRKSMKVNRSLAAKYTDWMKGGGVGNALMGVMGTFGSVGGEKQAGEFARFKDLDDEGLKRQVMKDWMKYRRMAIYDRENLDENEKRGEAAAELLTTFGVKVKAQVSGKAKKTIGKWLKGNAEYESCAAIFNGTQNTNKELLAVAFGELAKFHKKECRGKRKSLAIGSGGGDDDKRKNHAHALENCDSAHEEKKGGEGKEGSDGNSIALLEM